MKPGTYLKIVADSNDADYCTEINLIDSATLEKFKPLITEISKFKPYSFEKDSDFGPIGFCHTGNWPKGEYGCRKDLGEKSLHELYNKIDPEIIDQFDEEYVPYGEDGNIHTIKSIDLIEISKVTELLRRN
jgi:hypothetical protein